jgi:hypothetical protein
MHPEFKAALAIAVDGYPGLDAIALENSEKLLEYISDINLIGPDQFMPTPSHGLYIHWSVYDWEFHMECARSGAILYTFSRGAMEAESGEYPVDEFISRLEMFLLNGMS